MGKIISVVLPKGGVGKTTSAVNIAYNLAKSNFKTLLVDLDPTATCSLSLGFDQENIYGDIFDVFSFSKTIQSVIQPTLYPNLDCIPQIKLNPVEEGRQIKLTSNEYLLRNVINTISEEYKFIIFDCPPYLFGPTHLALIASDSVLIPIRTDEYSIDAVEELLKRIEYLRRSYNQKISVEGIFITSYEKNTKASFQIKTRLFRKRSDLMLNKSIPKDASLMNATFDKKPLSETNPKSRAALAYKELTEEIILRNFNIGI